MEIEQLSNPAISFENCLFEEENPRNVASASTVFSCILPIQQNGVNKYGQRGLLKKIRNGIFFGLIFLILLLLIALGMRHWTQKENFDAELEHLWSSKEDLKLQNELIVSQENHLEWQRNESQLYLGHIQLQAKLLVYKMKENVSMAEKLENAENSLQFCKSHLDLTMNVYWKYQERIWKKQEEIRHVERQLRIQENHFELHEKFISSSSENLVNEYGKRISLEQNLVEKEEKLKGLEMQADEWKMIKENLNPSVEKLGEKVAQKSVEIEWLDSKFRKLDEESTLLRLINESQTVKLGLIKSLKDQLAQKDEQIHALENLAHSQGKEKIFLDSKHQVHQEKMRKREEQIAEMKKQITGLKTELDKKQKAIEEAQHRLNRWNNCHYRHWC